MHSRPQSISFCDRSAEIFAYLEGDLEPSEEASLDRHFTECAACREELNAQKSFVNFLGSELTSDNEIVLPPDFAKVVSVNAANDVRGLHRTREIVVSTIICVGLCIIILAAAGAGGYLPQGSFLLDKLQALLSTAVHLIFSIGIGLSVILRSLTAGVAGGAGMFAALFIFAVAGAGIAFLYFKASRSRNA